MKRWEWWTLVMIVLVLAGAVLAANRYAFECVAVTSTGGIGSRPSGSYCYVLDRWTGKVSQGR